MRRFRAVGVGAALAWSAAGQLPAHEGHDHGTAPPPVSATIAPRFEASSESLEMVGVLRGGTLTLHLDRFRGNAPEGGASVELETPAGAVTARPMGEGRYALEAPWARPGKTELIATITTGGDIEVLPASLVVPDAAGGPPPGPADLAQRLPDGAVFVPKATQKILGLRNVMSEIGQHRRAVVLPGRVIPDPDASGLVQASVAGRLMPPPGGFPRLGASVKAGDVLALVMPAIPAADLTAQAQQARELDQAIALAQRKTERYRLAANAFPRAQAEDAEVELAGLRRRRAGLDIAPREPERLLAPVDGVIAASAATAGQIAEPSTVIFQVVDPARLWVEALSHAPVVQAGAASVALPGGASVALTLVGTGFSSRQQAVPVHYALPVPATGFRPGQLLSVHSETGEAKSGIAVPRASVVQGQSGLSLVFEQTNAERFVARIVRAEPLDGARMLILSGLEPGRRIVSEGAELLSQIR